MGRPLSFQVLGPLRVWREGAELDTGPRQQTQLLAILLMRSGSPVSCSELIELIWGDGAPPSALNTVHKYVGTLRRQLEPDVPVRTGGNFIHRRGNAYLFDASDVTLDLTEFRRLLGDSRLARDDRRIPEAVEAYGRALALWSGAAGDGLVLTASATPLIASINAELVNACVEAFHVAVPAGRARDIVQPLRLAAWIAPYDETLQASLMMALAAVGRQAEALSVFDTTRLRLAEELGIDPGLALRAAHQKVLQQAGAVHEETHDPVGRAVGEEFVGRREEIELLRQVVDAAVLSRPRLVVVDGPSGSGKSRLVVEVSDEAEAKGALAVWGRCVEGGGAPAMWPWVQVVDAMLKDLPASQRDRWMASDLGNLMADGDLVNATQRPDTAARFRLYGQVAALLSEAATRQPLLVIVEDLHWADTASLQLFEYLVESLTGSVVLIGTLRAHAPAPSEDLQRLLATVARQERHRRITLGPLEPADVAELIRRESGREPDPGVARSIQARTEGNPLFVRELARFLSDHGHLSDEVAAQSAVPATVRDIVRDRTMMLADEDRRLVEIASLMGRDIDVRLLARAAGVETSECLVRLQELGGQGLLEPSEETPGGWRFAHDLVRESVERSTPFADATRFHWQIAEALTHSQGAGQRHAEALAHHLVAAGPFAEPGVTAVALIAAGKVASRRSAYDTAQRFFNSAAEFARGAGDDDLELTALNELTAIAGIYSGFVGAPMDHLSRAEEIARSHAREREAAAFLHSRFLGHAQGLEQQAAGNLARRLQEHGRRSDDPVVQATGANAWGVYQWGSGNIGEAYRSLSRSAAMLATERDDDPLRSRLQMLTPVMLALNTTLHGDPAEGRRLFDIVEADAGDDPYKISIWGSFSSTAAAVAGDADWARRVSDIAIASDPEMSFSFSGRYPRLARHWAYAMSGGDAASEADEVERILEATLVSPPRSNLATWYALLAEIRLTAADPCAALAALDLADEAMSAHGERYAEGLVLLVRAQALNARGESPSVVVSAARRALDLSKEREAYLFAQRAQAFLDSLEEVTSIE